MKRKSCSASVLTDFAAKRQLGLLDQSTGRDSIVRQMYSQFNGRDDYNETLFWDIDYPGRVVPTGAIFNLTFSPEGQFLAAATENNGILLLDPLSRQLVKHVDSAHRKSVNCIRFLNSRLFASCSDDNKVALWDVRHMKKHIRLLEGHSTWVKSVEYSEKENLLVTAGLEGSIHIWDINKYCEQEQQALKSKVRVRDLMRIKITKDGTKMVITTNNSFMIVIHDLSLEHLKKDLKNFDATLYHLMQITGLPACNSPQFTHLFHAKRNRVELIADFPNDELVHSIPSIVLHPQGWVSATRCLSKDQSEEFTCVHDIQSYPPKGDENKPFSRVISGVEKWLSKCKDHSEGDLKSSIGIWVSRGNATWYSRVRASRSESDRAIRLQIDPISPELTRVQGSPMVSMWIPHEQFGRGQMQLVVVHHGNFGNSTSFVRRTRVAETNPTTVPREEPENNRNSLYSVSFDIEEDYDEGAFGRTGTKYTYESLKSSRYYQLYPRMTHYIKDSSSMRGIIKEFDISPDGRIIASPYDSTVRLLAFNDQARELCDEPPPFPSNDPKPLVVLKTLDKHHNEPVLSTAFSPNHMMLVTGCKRGKIVWHQPML